MFNTKAKVKYPLKDHWEKFKELRHPDTVSHIETILGEEISKDAFIISHSRICHSKNGKTACARNLWKFLSENDWIKAV